MLSLISHPTGPDSSRLATELIWNLSNIYTITTKMSSNRPQYNQAASSYSRADREKPPRTCDRVSGASRDGHRSQTGQQSPGGLSRSNDAAEGRRTLEGPSFDPQYSPRSACSAEGVHTDTAPRVTSARGNAQNRQQFFQRSARVSSMHDHPEGADTERGATEKSTTRQRVTFAQKHDFEEDIWMDVESPSVDSPSLVGRTAVKESRVSPETSLQLRKQAALYQAKEKQDINQKSMYYDAEEKLDDAEQFQTPPSTPVEAFSHKRRVLRTIEKASRVHSASSFSSTSSTMGSASLSQELSITSSSSESKNIKKGMAAHEKSREATGSTSSTMDYQDAMSELQMAEASVRHQFMDAQHMQRLPSESGASPSGSPVSSCISSTTLGLYQRRKMRRQILRLQSLEEVKMSRFSSESSDVGGVIPEDVEDDIATAFPSVSAPNYTKDATK